MKQTILNLTKEQDKKLGELAQSSVMVIAYYWGPGYMRIIPVPEKQATQFAKLLERYKEETEKEPGYETEAWQQLHEKEETS